VKDEAGKLLYWVGCMASYRTQPIAEATANVLKKLGVRFFTLGTKETCCGSIVLRAGLMEEAVKLARSNIELFSKLGVGFIVTSCPGCFRTIGREYEGMLGFKLPFPVQHTSMLLDELTRKPDAKLGEVRLKVAYHDPCHLGRHMGVYDAPRRVLQRIPGIEVVEMPFTREEALCCGAGGGVRSTYRELSGEAARTLILENFLSTGADTLVTACPFCYFNLSSAASELSVSVMDLPMLVEKALL